MKTGINPPIQSAARGAKRAVKGYNHEPSVHSESGENLSESIIQMAMLSMNNVLNAPNAAPKDLTGTWQQVEVIQATEDGKIVLSIGD